MFVPEVLRPEPDPAFVRELRKIDPELRVVFGYERYLVKKWAIERRMSPERYFSCYANLLENDAPRFVEQPIYDVDKPILDENGDFISYEQIGVRKFDLAPEYEWMRFAETLDSRVLTEIRREYAWNYNHSLTRQRIEKEQEEAQKKAKAAELRRDIGMDAVRDAWRAAGLTVQGGQPEKVMEGTEL